MTYQPRPLDLDDIGLPEMLRPLVERLAENNYYVWAAQRLVEGWVKNEDLWFGVFGFG